MKLYYCLSGPWHPIKILTAQDQKAHQLKIETLLFSEGKIQTQSLSYLDLPWLQNALQHIQITI